jgi:hypothetical protein
LRQREIHRVIRSILLAAMLALGLAARAEAAMLSFSYTASTGVIAGEFDGTLQPDNNSFIISAVSNVTFNGNPFAAGFVASADVAFAFAPVGLSGSAAGLVTLDGSLMDVAVCASALCIDGFQLSSGNAIEASFGFPLANSGPSFGSFFDVYFDHSWTADQNAIPAPGGIALFGLAMLGLGALRRRA